MKRLLTLFACYVSFCICFCLLMVEFMQMDMPTAASLCALVYCYCIIQSAHMLNDCFTWYNQMMKGD